MVQRELRRRRGPHLTERCRMLRDISILKRDVGPTYVQYCTGIGTERHSTGMQMQYSIQYCLQHVRSGRLDNKNKDATYNFDLRP